MFLSRILDQNSINLDLRVKVMDRIIEYQIYGKREKLMKPHKV